MATDTSLKTKPNSQYRPERCVCCGAAILWRPQDFVTRVRPRCNECRRYCPGAGPHDPLGLRSL